MTSPHLGCGASGLHLGRFLRVDPVDGGASFSDYGYVVDPINGSDLNGMWATGCLMCTGKLKGSIKQKQMRGVATCGCLTQVLGGSSFPSFDTPIRKAYQAFRFIGNLPTTIPALIAVKLTAGNTDCGMHWGQIMIVCTGADHGGMVQGGGTTYGSLFVTSEADVTDTLMEHEAKHADQWLIFGPTFGVLYPIAYGLQGECNVFEAWAGYEEGGYTQCV